MPATVYVNGKFTAQRTTGVQRTAARLVQALDDVVEGRWVLLCPGGATVPALQRMTVRRLGPPGLPLHLWEQSLLPFAARAGLLLSLAGSAPALAARQVCMLHDAAVFDQAPAYAPAFVRWYRWLFRRLARRAAGLLTVSHFSQSRLALHLGVEPGRIAVVPNGCDHLNGVQADDAVLRRLGLHGRRFLLAVASDNPSKNLPALLQAYARLPAEVDAALVIAGGRNPRVFADGAPQADPPGVVRAGPLQDAELKSLYQHATALVFPSLYEGFGLPPLEAMANGCPVVAARAASLPEVCGEAALYVDPHSVDELAVVLARVLGDAPLRQRLRDAGHARAVAFAWAASAQRLLAALPAGVTG